jgi:tetratricopeptide (TPR) repeat protein
MEKEYIQELVDNGILQENPDYQLLKELLDKLREKGFISELSNQFYEFENNITWEVVYETLLFSERRYIHALIASHIEKNNEDNLGDVADILSHHYQHAGDDNNFIKYIAMSGDRSANMFANDDALNSYKTAIDAILKIDPVNIGDMSMLEEKLGDVFEASGKYSKAVESYQRSFDIWSNGTDYRRKIKYLKLQHRPGVRNSQLCQKIAAASEHDGKYDDSIIWLDKAEKHLPKRYGNVATQIMATRCVVMFRRGEYKPAIKVGKKAVSLAKKKKDKRGTAYAYRVLALNYALCGKHTEAISCNKKSEEIYEELDDYQGIATVSNNLAFCLQRLAKLESALEYFQIALDAEKKVQNEFGITIGYLNFGNVSHEKGELVNAEDYMDKVIQAYEEGICPPDMAGAAWTTKAVCALENKDNDLALSYANQAIDLINKTGQAGFLLYARLLKSEIVIAMGDYTLGYSEIEHIRKEIEDSGNDSMMSLIYRLTGYAKSKMGFLDEAVASYENSVKLYHDLGETSEEAFSIFHQIKSLIEADYEYPALKDNLNRAINIFKSMGNKLYLDRCLELQKSIH